MRFFAVPFHSALACCFLTALGGCASAPKSGGAPPAPAAPKPQLLIKSFQSSVTHSKRDYWLYLPAGYDADPLKKWPMILFLHGRGERGDVIQKVLVHGPLMEVAKKSRDLPFIILAPQMPILESDEIDARRPAAQAPRAQEGSKQAPMKRETRDVSEWTRRLRSRGWPNCEKDLLFLVDDAVKRFRVDPDRIYLTGISMGGYGSWHMAIQHPDRWAAVAPICGGGDPAQSPKIGKTPVWVFHGGRDPIVPVEMSLAMANALEQAGGDVRLTVHEELKHNCWTRVYEGEDIYQWFLSHKRGETPAVKAERE